MAWALKDVNFIANLPADMHIIFVIRNPEDAVISHEKLQNTNTEYAKEHGLNLSFSDTVNTMDYTVMQKMIARAQELGNINTTLIDADDLANKSEAILRVLCAKLDLTFDVKVLNWNVGECEFWPYTKETWKKNVTNSDGFMPLQKRHKMTNIDPKDQTALQLLIEHNIPIYRELTTNKLHAPRTKQEQIQEFIENVETNPRFGSDLKTINFTVFGESCVSNKNENFLITSRYNNSEDTQSLYYNLVFRDVSLKEWKLQLTPIVSIKEGVLKISKTD